MNSELIIVLDRQKMASVIYSHVVCQTEEEEEGKRERSKLKHKQNAVNKRFPYFCIAMACHGPGPKPITAAPLNCLCKKIGSSV